MGLLPLNPPPHLGQVDEHPVVGRFAPMLSTPPNRALDFGPDGGFRVACLQRGLADKDPMSVVGVHKMDCLCGNDVKVKAIAPNAQPRV